MSASCVTLDIEVYESLQEELSILRQRVAELEQIAACSHNTERQLRSGEAKFEKLAEVVPGMIYQYLLLPDGSACFLFASASCRELYEVEPDEIQANAALIFDMIHPDDRQSVLDAIAASAATLQPWRGEWRIRTPAGRLKWIQGASRPEMQADGSILWDGLLMDITERKAASSAQSEAQLLQQAQRALLLNQLASQIRNSLDLDTILETTVQAIRELLQIDRCNFSWYRPHGEAWETTKEGKAPHLPSQVGLLYPVSAIGSASEKILEGQIIRVDEVATFTEPVLRQFLVDLGYKSVLILPIKRRSGEICVLTCGNCQSPRSFSDGEVELLQAAGEQLAIAINQAELYAATEEAAKTAQLKSLELEKTLHELQRTQTHLIQSEKMSSLGQLVAGVAHEINNPVNFIYGNLTHAREYSEDLLNLLQLYQQHYPNPKPEIESEIEAIDLDFLVEDLPKMLSSMKVGAERIREIVLSLRNFSRLDEAQMKEVNIHEGLNSTLLILDSRLKVKPDHPAICVFKEYGNLPPVECYAGPLNQVFMNLLTNAIDVLEEAKENPSPCIKIRTEVIDGGYIAIRIADNGSGMTEEVRKHLFNPFFTTKPVGKGTGLGLSISYQIIVEKHKGRLYCLSQPGLGTEFVIEIPIQQP